MLADLTATGTWHQTEVDQLSKKFIFPGALDPQIALKQKYRKLIAR
jgi:hypothetical protein